MINLREAKIGDSFFVTLIDASANDIDFLRNLGIGVGSELEILSNGYFHGSVIVRVCDINIQLNSYTVNKIYGELIKKKVLKK